MHRLIRCAAACAVLVSGNGAVAAGPGEITLPHEGAKLLPSTLPGYAKAMQKCVICHSIDYISYQPPGMSQAQWTAEIGKMQHLFGAPISDTEVKQIGAYLAVAYGSAKETDPAIVAGSAAAPAAAASGKAGADAKIDVQALLASHACLSCHGLKQKIVGPGYHEIAEKYKADAQAQAHLVASIHAGSVGKWGTMPMPPFSTLTPDELKALAEFVLRQ